MGPSDREPASYSSSSLSVSLRSFLLSVAVRRATICGHQFWHLPEFTPSRPPHQCLDPTGATRDQPPSVLALPGLPQKTPYTGNHSRTDPHVLSGFGFRCSRCVQISLRASEPWNNTYNTSYKLWRVWVWVVCWFLLSLLLGGAFVGISHSL